MTKPVVFVLGASGSIGSATIQALSSKYSNKVEIRAGVRNPDKADKLKGLRGVQLVQADMGDKEKLTSTLKGVHALFVVTPGADKRVQLTINAVEAGKAAGVTFVLVITGQTAGLTDTILGRQLYEIESTVPKLGIPYSFLRLPFFMDNLWGFKDTIKNQSTIYSPMDPTKPFAAVATQDAGNAAATILVNPSDHYNKAYVIASDRYSYNDVVREFSSVLGREIKFIRVSYEAAKQTFLGFGRPEWQVDGLFEFFKLFDSGSPVVQVTDMSAYEQITGEKPISLKQYVAQIAPAFK